MNRHTSLHSLYPSPNCALKSIVHRVSSARTNASLPTTIDFFANTTPNSIVFLRQRVRTRPGKVKKSKFYFARARTRSVSSVARAIRCARSSDVTRVEASFFTFRHSYSHHVETRHRLARHCAFYDDTDADSRWCLAHDRSSARVVVGVVVDVSVILELSSSLRRWVSALRARSRVPPC